MGLVDLFDVEVVRVRQDRRTTAADRVVVEEPLDIRIHGQPFATLMRTPGADPELAAGFLLSERVLRSADELGAIEHCRDGTDPDQPAENIVNVTLVSTSAKAVEDALAMRRHVVANSSCGVCGRVSIEKLRDDLQPISEGEAVPAAIVAALPDTLRLAQRLFEESGGLHAAGLFDRTGRLTTSAEDVGRHNAVDKVIGRMLMADRVPLDDQLLFVSGRTSFEIVQKAWCAGIPVVAAVSAPSSLAITLAEEAGITLVGFVRDGGFNVYAHPRRTV
jgi:FdhD protein